MFGRDPILPIDRSLEKDQPIFNVNNTEDSYPKFVDDIQYNLQCANKEVEMNQSLSHQRNQRIYNQHHRIARFSKGDIVKLKIEATNPGQPKKLSPVWKGPYVIMDIGNGETHSVNDYLIKWRENPEMKAFWVNGSKLDRYYDVNGNIY
jgi:hypothetical protein